MTIPHFEEMNFWYTGENPRHCTACRHFHAKESPQCRYSPVKCSWRTGLPMWEPKNIERVCNMNDLVADATDKKLSDELDARINAAVVEDLSRAFNEAVSILETLLASAHRNERDYMPAEWHDAVDAGHAFLKRIGK